MIARIHQFSCDCILLGASTLLATSIISFIYWINDTPSDKITETFLLTSTGLLTTASIVSIATKKSKDN